MSSLALTLAKLRAEGRLPKSPCAQIDKLKKVEDGAREKRVKVEKSATASTAGIVTGDGLAEVPAPAIPPAETTDEGSTEAEPAPAVDAESVPPASTPASAPAGRGIFGGGK